MSRFEDNLWAELERDHAPALRQSVATRRRRSTARWLSAAAGVAVLGGATVVGLTYFGGTPPAYAVVDNPDGSVTLTLRDLTRFEEATERLREHGIFVVVVPLRKDCPDEGPYRIEGAAFLPARADSTADGLKMIFERDWNHAGTTSVLAADLEARSVLRVGIDGGREVPKCLPDQLIRQSGLGVAKPEPTR
ncbi:hypothetical protein ACIA8G_13640 [Lentzea sp. NPDC051213]|uniref:hypothetical protein n=1 Tax=Lentzea sp. NPDC051213 TaxID=3364126 RepID=UPI0037B55F0F